MTHVRKLTMRDTKGLQSEVILPNNGCPPIHDAILRFFRFSDVDCCYFCWRKFPISCLSSDMMMWFGNFSNPVCENVELKVAKLTGFFFNQCPHVLSDWNLMYTSVSRILYQVWKHYPVEFLTIFSVLTKILWNQHFYAHKN